MTDYCRYLDLYDPEEQRLSEWADIVWDSVDQRTQAVITEIEDPDQVFERFCEQYDVSDPESLSRQYVTLVEHVRERANIPPRCPHDPVGDSGRCVFHLGPEQYDEHGISEREVTREFFGTAHSVTSNSPDDSMKCFVGAKFGRLDLRYQTLGTYAGYPINLQLSTIEELVIEEARIEQPVLLDGATIDVLRATNANFQGKVSFSGATLGPGDIDFERADFAGSMVDLTGTTVTSDRLNFSETVFEGASLDLEGARICTRPEAGRCTVDLRRATINNADLRFEGAQIGQRRLQVELEGDPSPGGTVAVTVRLGRREIQDALVVLSGQGRQRRVVGRTNEDGCINVELPEGIDIEQTSIEVEYADLNGQVALNTDRVGSMQKAADDNRCSVVLTQLSLRNGDIQCRGSQFHGPVDLRYAEIDGQFLFFPTASFYDSANFSDSFIDVANCDLNSAEFFGPTVDFRDAVLPSGSTAFQAVEFEIGELNAARTTFGGDKLTFDDATIDAETVTFDRADFAAEQVTFDDMTVVADRISFDNSRLDCDLFSLESARLDASTVSFSNMNTSDGELRFIGAESPVPIDMSGSELEEGVISQPSDGQTRYRLDRAVVGDVRFSDDGAQSSFEQIRFLETRFDGFSFSQHNQALSDIEWMLHRESPNANNAEGLQSESNILSNLWSRSKEYWQLVYSGPELDPKIRPSQLENTYRNAKNGADKLGETKPVSEFFQNELFFRRRKHGRQIWDRRQRFDLRLRAAQRWTYNYLLGLVTGYGEQPRRVVVWSVLIVLLFGGLYEISWATLAAAPPESYRSLSGSLVLSLESFTTLVLGAGGVDTVPVRLLGYLEGFIGAFLIALFVFTLTRSIRR